MIAYGSIFMPYAVRPHLHDRAAEAARDATPRSRALTVSDPDRSISFSYEKPIGEQGAGKQKSRRADSNRRPHLITSELFHR